MFVTDQSKRSKKKRRSRGAFTSMGEAHLSQHIGRHCAAPVGGAIHNDSLATRIAQVLDALLVVRIRSTSSRPRATAARPGCVRSQTHPLRAHRRSVDRRGVLDYLVEIIGPNFLDATARFPDEIRQRSGRGAIH
jgi:hypothetical protein